MAKKNNTAGSPRLCPPLRVIFYIDALNFYCGAVRETPFKWLNYAAYCGQVLRSGGAHFNEHSIWRPQLDFLFSHPEWFQIGGVKIFTAYIKQFPGAEPGAPERQKLYYQALRAHCRERIEFKHGKFFKYKTKLPDAQKPHPPRTVIRMEEKQSDVNLALQMFSDAVDDKCDCAVVASNDTDLTAALEMTRARGKLVGVISPANKNRRPAGTLVQNADFYFNTSEKPLTDLLASCQLPEIVRGKEKVFHKPAEWSAPQ